jgi:hypothetical protein
MLLVIFGAGASYDSAPSYGPPPGGQSHLHRPPLADELFDDRPVFRAAFQRYPECLPLIANLRHRTASTTVEQELDRFQAEAAEYPARHQQLMAIRYCLQHLLIECVRYWGQVHGGVTNYVTLLDHIRRWSGNYERVVLVTFNYDTMLDTSLIGTKISSINDYINSPTYILIKAHGSVNWARDIQEPYEIEHRPEAMIQNAAKLIYTDRWWVTDDYPVASVTIPAQAPRPTMKRPAAPSLALPLQSKAEFECPVQHLNFLEASLPKVSKALIIGWRGMERHFTDMLKRLLLRPGPQWHIVAGSTRAAEEVQATN